MREKGSQASYDEEQYFIDRQHNSSSISKRIDLNDLLKRAKEQKKNDIKINLFIYTGVALVLAVFLFTIIR